MKALRNPATWRENTAPGAGESDLINYGNNSQIQENKWMSISLAKQIKNQTEREKIIMNVQCQQMQQQAKDKEHNSRTILKASISKINHCFLLSFELHPQLFLPQTESHILDKFNGFRVGGFRGLISPDRLKALQAETSLKTSGKTNVFQTSG